MKNTELVPKSDLKALEDLNKGLAETEEYVKKLSDTIATLHKTFSDMGTSAGQLKRASDELNKTEAETIELLRRLTQLEQARETIKKKIQAEEEKVTASVEKQKKALDGLTSAQNANNKAQQNLIKSIQQIVTARTQGATQAKQLAILRRNAITLLQTESGSLAANRAELNMLSQALTLVTAEEMENGQAAVNLKKRYDELYKTVTQQEQVMGKFQRNVGNYKSAFDGLGFSVQQIVRELPSLAMGPQMFFLAISNNLPMLADQIKIVRAEQAQLRSEGQKGTPVWKQLAKSIVSWQTALVVGITLLVQYSDEIIEWAKKLFKGRDAALSTAEAVGEINKSLDFKSLGSKIADFQRLAIAYRDIGDNAKAKQEFIEKYRDELDKTGIAVNTINEADNLFITNSAAYIASLQQRAQAVAGQKLAAEQYEKAIQDRVKRADVLKRLREQKKFLESQDEGYVKEEIVQVISGDQIIENKISQTRDELLKKVNASIKLEESVADAFNAAGDKYVDVTNEMYAASQQTLKNAGLEELDPDEDGDTEGDKPKDYAEARKRLAEEQRKAMHDNIIAEKEREAEKLQAIADDEQKSFTERLDALKAFSVLRQQIIDQQAEFEVEEAIDKAAKELELDKKNAKDRIELEKQIAETIKGIRQNQKFESEDLAEEVNLQKDDIAKWTADNLMSQVSQKVAEKAAPREESKSAELAALSDRYAQGLIDEEEYQKERQAIIRKYEEQAYNDEVSMLESLMGELEKYGLDKSIIEEAIAQLESKRRKQLNEQLIKDNEEARAEEDRQNQEAIDKKIETNNRIMELSREMFNFIGALSEANKQRQLDALDEEMEAYQKYYDDRVRQIEMLEESGAISKEQANARKAQADQQLKEKEEEIEKKKEEAEKKNFYLQQSQAAASVIMNTAVATMRAWADTGPLGGPVFGAIIAAMGAAQLATIMAQTITAYAEGTDFHPGGPAIVGDGGRPEAIIIGHSVYKTPDVPTLVDMPRGAKVLPDWNAITMDMVPRPYTGRELPPEHSRPYDDRNVLRMLEQNNCIMDRNNRTIDRFMRSYQREKLNNRYYNFIKKK